MSGTAGKILALEETIDQEAVATFVSPIHESRNGFWSLARVDRESIPGSSLV